MGKINSFCFRCGPYGDWGRQNPTEVLKQLVCPPHTGVIRLGIKEFQSTANEKTGILRTDQSQACTRLTPKHPSQTTIGETRELHGLCQGNNPDLLVRKSRQTARF